MLKKLLIVFAVSVIFLIGIYIYKNTNLVKFVQEYLERSSYKCPTTEWVNCMPGINSIERPECKPKYLQWAKENCPAFKGHAV